MAAADHRPPGRFGTRARGGEHANPTGSVKVGHLATRPLVTAEPSATLREAARTMHDHGCGSVVVLDAGTLVGILTERDILRAAATAIDLDTTRVEQTMTREVVRAAPDWEVYEAAAEMTDKHIRHLVVVEDGEAVGVLSIRDVLLAGQRIELSEGSWAVLRDPLTFTVRERRRLQRLLLDLDRVPTPRLDVDALTGVLVGSWSFELPLPPDVQTLESLPEEDRALLRAAVIDELPELQRAVQPAPGWRRWTQGA